MRLKIAGFCCVALLGACKSTEDERYFASSYEQRLEEAKAKEKDNEQGKPGTAGMSSIPEKPSNPSAANPPAANSPNQNVGQSRTYSTEKLAGSVLGKWLGSCQRAEEIGGEVWYKRVSLRFDSGGVGQQSVAYFTDKACSKAPAADTLNMMELEAENIARFTYGLDPTDRDNRMALDFTIAGESSEYLTLQVEGSQLTVTRSCSQEDKETQLCSKLSGASQASRALDFNFVWTYRKS